MSDVQVSNARRVVFTAMALVVFWVIAWKTYWSGIAYGPQFSPVDIYDPQLSLVEIIFGWGRWTAAPLTGLVLATVPMIFMSMSIRNSPLDAIRDPALWRVGIALVCCLIVCFGLGQHDADSAFLDFGDNESRMFWRWSESQIVSLGIAVRVQPVSWPWLLLPLLLTTAFVIYGAWRRAVKDAAIQAVDEDE